MFTSSIKVNRNVNWSMWSNSLAYCILSIWCLFVTGLKTQIILTDHYYLALKKNLPFPSLPSPLQPTTTICIYYALFHENYNALHLMKAIEIHESLCDNIFLRLWSVITFSARNWHGYHSGIWENCYNWGITKQNM